MLRKAILMSITTYNGAVKFFNASKGYGFIHPDDGSSDVFLHITELDRSGLTTPRDGQRVNYELKTEKGKTSAHNITFISE